MSKTLGELPIVFLTFCCSGDWLNIELAVVCHCRSKACLECASFMESPVSCCQPVSKCCHYIHDFQSICLSCTLRLLHISNGSSKTLCNRVQYQKAMHMTYVNEMNNFKSYLFKLCFMNLLCRRAGLNVKQYRYYDNKTFGFDFNGALEDISVRYQLIIYLYVL